MRRKIVKMKSNAKIIILIALGILSALSPIINNSLNFNAGNSENNLDDEKRNLTPSKISGRIHIDNNWTDAKAAGICTGDGNYSDPYVIEDLEIDAESSGSCILIENSDVYLRIENCIVYNSGPSYPNAGIGLSNVTNSLIITNNCSSNWCGISLSRCNNNTISGNTVKYNIRGIHLSYSNNAIVLGNDATDNINSGIYLGGSDNSHVSGNNATNNTYGIYLYSSDDNNVSGNTANSNNDDGIYLTGGYSRSGDGNTLLGNIANSNSDNGISIASSNYNNVSGNIANSNSDHGISLYSSDDNNVSGNTANSNNEDGIYLQRSDNNTLSDNNASYNNESGICLTSYSGSCEGNSLSGNNASYNKVSGIFLSYSDYTFLLGNTVKNNILYGVYLSQSRNNIIEGNFIINNDVGIYVINNLYYYTLFQIKNPDNEISSNIYDGNNQDILEVTKDIDHSDRSVKFSLFILLSIAIVCVVIISLTVELITKRSYPREDEKYQLPICGISAVVIESAGALLFLLGAAFLIPIEAILFWLLILIPFAVVGIIISRDGLKKDAKKNLAGLGIVFGILLLILNAQLILTGLLVVVVIIVIVIVIIVFLYCAAQ